MQLFVVVVVFLSCVVLLCVFCLLFFFFFFFSRTKYSTLDSHRMPTRQDGFQNRDKVYSKLQWPVYIGFDETNFAIFANW